MNTGHFQAVPELLLLIYLELVLGLIMIGKTFAVSGKAFVNGSARLRMMTSPYHY